MVAVIGAGRLGTQIALRLSGNYKVLATVKTEASLRRLKELGIEAHTDNRWAVEKSDYVILAVKPHNMPELDFRTDRPLISFVAGATLERLSALSSAPYRAMTNVGLTSIAVAGRRDPQVEALLSSIAPTFWVEERLMDPLTVLLGSGPAIAAEMASWLIYAAVNVGVPWDLARELALDLLASLRDMDRRFGLEKLAQHVATPGGTTIAALVEMPEGRRLLAQAFERALSRISRLR